MPRLEYAEYITQGGGQTAHVVQRAKLPLFTPGVCWGCTGGVGCWTGNLFLESHHQKNE